MGEGDWAEEASCSYTWIPRNKYSQTYFFFLFLFFIGFPIIFLGLTTSSKIILQLSNLRFTLFIVKYLLVSASFITRQISCWLGFNVSWYSSSAMIHVFIYLFISIPFFFPLFVPFLHLFTFYFFFPISITQSVFFIMCFVVCLCSCFLFWLYFPLVYRSLSCLLSLQFSPGRSGITYQMQSVNDAARATLFITGR